MVIFETLAKSRSRRILFGSQDLYSMTGKTAFYSMIMFSVLCVLFLQRIAGQDVVRNEMARLIPEPLPAGLVAQKNAEFFGPDTLFQYMDGGADIFLLYGVRELMHLEMQGKLAEITVDVFDMGSADTAFGMYAAERSLDEPYIAVGAEGYKNKGALNFLQDRYYVKLLGFGADADGELEAVASLVSARIGTNPGMPTLLAQLPLKNRKPHSEQFMPNDPLGHSFLGPAYVLAYTLEGHENKMYITVGHDEVDARHRLQQLHEHFIKTGKCEAAPEIGEGAIRASNSFEGGVIAQTKGRYLILLLNPTAGGGQLLKDAADVLR